MSPTDRPPSRPIMAQKMLQQSREAKSALADALTFDSIDSYTRTPKGKGDHSDDSETSSICSERSHDSFRRPSDVSVSSITLSMINQSHKLHKHLLIVQSQITFSQKHNPNSYF